MITVSNGKRKLFRIIFLNRFKFKILLLCFSILAAFLGLAVPYFQRQFSNDLNNNTLYVCLIITLGYLICNQITLFIGQSESIHAQRKLAQELYTHQLKLKSFSIQNRSVGEMVSLYSTDVPSVVVWLEQSFPYGLTTLFPLLLTPIFLNQLYDLPLELSFFIIFVMVLVNSLMAYRQSLFFFKFKQLAAARMGLVNEWIQNIRGLKILNWISGFETRIFKKRREETYNRILMVTNGQIMNSISSSMMFWLNLALLSYFIWFFESPISKADVISLLWITAVFLSRPLRQLPWFFTFLFDAWTSFKRISDFLNTENPPIVIKHNFKPNNQNHLLHVKNLNLSLNKNKLLKDINLDVFCGEIIALIGPVGSGKTLLVKSLINETPFSAEEFYSEKISYLPQEHFIMSASLRDNMNFQYGSNLENDSRVINYLTKAQFNFELDRIQNGLDTVVGERGLNLSGGQKQRLSLARQLMQPEKLILLDDPLSAVDINTEKLMISELINLKQQNHSILITTQRFNMLSHCDRIIYIDKGAIICDLPASEFLNRDEYQSFLKGLV